MFIWNLNLRDFERSYGRHLSGYCRTSAAWWRWSTGDCFNIKMFTSIGNPIIKNKTIVIPSYLYNGMSYVRKDGLNIDTGPRGQRRQLMASFPHWPHRNSRPRSSWLRTVFMRGPPWGPDFVAFFHTDYFFLRLLNLFQIYRRLWFVSDMQTYTCITYKFISLMP